MNTQFVSVCKEYIVCLWLIDNERPLKVFYFNTPFKLSIPFTSSRVTLNGEPTIDKILLMGNYKCFELEVKTAPLYRSYNEDVHFEWDCFTFEMNK